MVTPSPLRHEPASALLATRGGGLLHEASMTSVATKMESWMRMGGNSVDGSRDGQAREGLREASGTR
jgi:hypothetical protein